LVLYTDLPEIWDLFEKSISFIPPTEGGFSLMGLQVIASTQDIGLGCSIYVFWDSLEYMLSRKNNIFIARRKARRKK